MGLLDAFKQYIKDALPGGLLNPEAAQLPGLLNAQANATAQAIKAKGQSFKRGLDDPQKYAGEAFAAGMDMAGMAPLGLTVWHGSPHKFNKFDMSKIGTGEGAQAYGHGLYMAENKGVAATYADALGSTEQDFVNNAINRIVHLGNKDVSGNRVRDALVSEGYKREITPDLESLVRKIVNHTDADGTVSDAALGYYRQLEKVVPKSNQLYKVDIPDEAVARMLDWDKPLSQQAPEVQRAFTPAEAKQLYQAWRKKTKDPLELGNFYEQNGNELYGLLSDLHGKDKAAQILKEKGLQGIRYLDGGSRSAGQGSSNFVLFDDQLPRILEINGQPTGQVPWKPSEWRGLLAP